MNAGATMNHGASPKTAGESGISQLIADIEAVLANAGNVADLDATKLRDSLRQKIAAAKSGFVAGGRRITAAAGATDDYVHGSPWQAMAVAALAGAAVGYLLARR